MSKRRASAMSERHAAQRLTVDEKWDTIAPGQLWMWSSPSFFGNPECRLWLCIVCDKEERIYTALMLDSMKLLAHLHQLFDDEPFCI